MLDFLVPLAIGLGLSAACGFRVFLPLLGMGLAARLDYLPLASDVAWAASTPALLALFTATVVEIVAYYVPWLDNLLDTVATPMAVLAGIAATASVLTDVPPYARWSLAIIAGGGVAGVVQGATVAARLKSVATTAGVGNPVIATVELAGAAVTTVMALVFPVAAITIVLVMCLLIFLVTRRLLFGRRRRAYSVHQPLSQR